MRLARLLRKETSRLLTGPFGQRVMVKSLASGQTIVRTSSGWLYAAEHEDCPAGQLTTWQLGYPEAPTIEGVRVIPPAANGLPLMLEIS